jgi:hypothetical protein
VCEEFFNQGDIEKDKGMPVSMYCDRDNTNIAKSQTGFIQNLVLPLYEVVNAALKSNEIQRTCIRQIHINIKYWTNYGKSKRKTMAIREDSEQSSVQLYDTLKQKLRKKDRHDSLDKTKEELLSKERTKLSEEASY